MSNPIADLYAGSWEGFVGRRTEMAAAIRSSGDRVAAKAVSALRKPTRGAWLVNLLVHRELSRVAEVFEVGEELARAHRDADPEELRRLSAMAKAVIESLTQQAVALGAEQGYSATDPVRLEIAETLQAAMGDPALADKVLEGALVATVRAAGFGPADLFAPVAEALPVRPDGPAVAPPPAPDPVQVRRLERERGRAEGRLEEARARSDRARNDEERASTELELSRAEVAEVDDRLAGINQLLAEVTAERDRVAARELEREQALAEHTAVREMAEDEADGLARLVAELTERLAELGLTD